MIDASNGMLSKAKEKIDAMNLSDYVDVKQAFLPKIPFADNTFDVVMINQVITDKFKCIKQGLIPLVKNTNIILKMI